MTHTDILTSAPDDLYARLETTTADLQTVVWNGVRSTVEDRLRQQQKALKAELRRRNLPLIPAPKSATSDWAALRIERPNTRGLSGIG